MQEMRRCEINIIIYCNKLTPYYNYNITFVHQFIGLD